VLSVRTIEIIQRAEELERKAEKLAVDRLDREDLLDALADASRAIMLHLRYELRSIPIEEAQERLCKIARVAVSTAIVDNRIHEKVRPEELSRVKEGLLNLLIGLVRVTDVQTASRVLEALIMRREITKAKLGS